jgi:hypothetical protein
MFFTLDILLRGVQLRGRLVYRKFALQGGGPW